MKRLLRIRKGWGRLARFGNLLREDNPFPPGSYSFEAWDDGYKEADAELAAEMS